MSAVAAGTDRLIDPYDRAALESAADTVLAAPMPAADCRAELTAEHA